MQAINNTKEIIFKLFELHWFFKIVNTPLYTKAVMISYCDFFAVESCLLTVQPI